MEQPVAKPKQPAEKRADAKPEAKSGAEKPVAAKPSNDGWRRFKPGLWQRDVNVRWFLQQNYTPYDGDGAFLRQMVGLREGLVADRLLRHHALDEAAAVADRQEVDLPAGAAVVQPPADRDVLALVLGDAIDIGNHKNST